MVTNMQFEQAITTSFADAVAFHGDLALPVGSWKRRVLATLHRCHRHIDDDAAAAFAQRLHSRDLYLATACAEGIDSAWRRFEALYRKYVDELIRCLARNPLQASDVSEALLVDLFLPDRSGQSRIGSYDGRSSLATWLHVIVTHRLANERVRKWNNVERPGDVPDVADVSVVRYLEADISARRYAPARDAALRTVCQALTPRERQMLAWRYQGGMLLEQIAARLSVHTSTVCRQLERLQDRIRAEVIATLSQTYGMNAEAISECLRDLLDNLGPSVSVLGLICDELPADRAAPDARHVQIA